MPKRLQRPGGSAAFLWQKFDSEIVVHIIFTVLFAITLWAAVRERNRLED